MAALAYRQKKKVIPSNEVSVPNVQAPAQPFAADQCQWQQEEWAGCQQGLGNCRIGQFQCDLLQPQCQIGTNDNAEQQPEPISLLVKFCR